MSTSWRSFKLLKSRVWVLSSFPAVADPSIVEQWRVPVLLAKRVAELAVFPHVHTPTRSLEFLQRLFPPNLRLEGQNLSPQLHVLKS